MSCDLSGTVIEFEKSGVKVMPLKIRFSEGRGKFVHATATVTAEAAAHIVENAETPEAVRILVGGNLLRRMYLPREGVSVGNERGTLQIADPRRLLRCDTVNYVNDDLTLGDAIRWFKGRVFAGDWTGTDPNEVITDILPAEGMGARQLERRSRSIMAQITTVTDTRFDDWVDDIARDVFTFTLNAVDSHIDIVGEDGGLLVEDLNLHQTLLLIEETWAVDSWMDDEGVLRIGITDSDPTMYQCGVGLERWKLHSYDINIDPYPVRNSWVRGAYYRSGAGETTAGFNEAETVGIRKWGYATFGTGWDARFDPENNSGDTIVSTLNTLEDGALKRQAKRKLLQGVWRERAGSVTILPQNSPRTLGEPADVRVGDMLFVSPGEGDQRCNKAIDRPTIFGITRVEHEVSGNNGWELNLSVNAVPHEPIFVSIVSGGLGDIPYTSDVELNEVVDLTAIGKEPEYGFHENLKKIARDIFFDISLFEDPETGWRGGR